MPFLADENFPVAIVSALRETGHDIEWVGNLSPGISDEDVVDLATRSNRTILAFDKDFGYLTFRRGVSAPAGIILFRDRAASFPRSVDEVVELLDSPRD